MQLVNSQIEIKEEPIEELTQNQQPITNKISINERKKLESKNWYEKNKEYHKAKVKDNDIISFGEEKHVIGCDNS